MRKARIAVLVSGGGTNLQAILDAQAAGILHSGRVALVISDRPGAYALERARKAGVPLPKTEDPVFTNFTRRQETKA